MFAPLSAYPSTSIIIAVAYHLPTSLGMNAQGTDDEYLVCGTVSEELVHRLHLNAIESASKIWQQADFHLNLAVHENEA
jgi:hypothetical protein